MDKKQMLAAFALLDKKLDKPLRLLLGGGGAMVLACNFPIATHDLDALPFKSKMTDAEIFPLVQKIAEELNLPRDWLNPHFGTFLYTLPKDYDTRLKTVFTGQNLRVEALGLEDMLVLKCFAGRDKDISHVRALIRKGANADLARQHIFKLIDKNIPKAKDAADFLDELLDED